MNIMFEVAQRASEPKADAVLHLNRELLARWHQNPLHFLARTMGLSAAEAGQVCDLSPQFFGCEPPAGLKLPQFEAAIGRLCAGLLMRMCRPDEPVQQLAFASDDSWCEAENVRLQRRDEERQATIAERRAARGMAGKFRGALHQANTMEAV